MINLAVIELKDIIKYLIKITIAIAIIVGLTKFFSGFKTQLNVDKNSFLSCLDVAIPSIKNVNQKNEEKSSTATTEPLKMALGVELGMMGSVEKNGETMANENGSEKIVGTENIDANTTNNTENEVADLEEAKTGLNTEIINTNVPEKFTTEYNGVKIRNETDNIKLTDEMLKPEVSVNMKNILIYHTHASESYTSSEKFKYTATGNFRTTDINYNVVRVGTELTKYMQHYGYNVVHDMTIYDKSYSESYDRSLSGVAKLLKENEDTDILFDVHRDAIADSSYAPTVKIGDEEVAQLMFVIGSNGGGSKHDDWNQNLKLAIKIQEKANELYPGLFKPIILRDSRYNQQLATGASIIEVGATGNTMEQCLASMKYLSKVLSEVLK